MKEEEKQINIKIQNNNCLIYLNNNELSLFEKTNKQKNEEILNEDDIKEMSYSISNVSEAYSSKRKQNIIKNNFSKEKIDFEISNISIFNSNIKIENSYINTPLYAKNNVDKKTNEINSKNKDKNHDFKESLKSKKINIKKLKFDSDEWDTIHETDTIKRFYNDKNYEKEKSEETISTENINKNLHIQFISNTLPDFIDSNKNKYTDKISTLPNNMNNKCDLSEKKIKIIKNNIAYLKDELISTINYKLQCIEKYNKKRDIKPLIHNNKIDIKCMSFPTNKIKENKFFINKTKKEYKNKDKIKFNTKEYNQNNTMKKIYNKNIITRHFSYISKKRISNKNFNFINSRNNLNNNKINSKNIYNLSLKQ